MAHDDDLADRLRAALAPVAGLTEKRMFGGLGFLVHGRLAVSASSRGGLLLRCDPAETKRWVEEPGVERFEMRGRELDGWLHVARSAVAGDDDLGRWVDVGVRYARSLPPPPRRAAGK